MKISFKAALLAAALAGSAAAHAELIPRGHWYHEIGLASQSLEATDGTDVMRARPTAVALTLGNYVTPWLALEGMVNVGLKSDDFKYNDINTPVPGKIDASVGIFLKPTLRVSRELDLFARVGYMHHRFAVGSEKAEAGDVAFGLGANVYLNRDSYVSTSWTSGYDKYGVKSNSLSVTYGVKF